MFYRVALIVAVLAALAGPAFAQGPNYIVPTAPAGTSNNQAASTAFVQSAIGGITVAINPTLPPYNAVCNGSGDWTTQIQAAATAAIAAKLPLLIPGICQISGTIDVSGLGMLVGYGPLISAIRTTSATADIISKNSANPIRITGLSIKSLNLRSAGAGILLNGNAVGDVINFVLITDQWNGIQCLACIGMHIYDATISDTVNHGIDIANTVNGDSGDNFIGPNVLMDTSSVSVTTTGIYQVSSGGLYINDVKIIHHDYGYQLDVANSANTGFTNIHNSNFDTQHIASVFLQRSSGAGQWATVNIAGSIMVSSNVGGTVGTCISIQGAAAWIANVLIDGNNCKYITNGVNLAAGTNINVTRSNIWDSAAAGNPAAILLAAAFPTAGIVDLNALIANTTTLITTNGNVGMTVIPRGMSVTKTVRASGGAADCTLIFASGILTGGSC